MLFLGNVGVLDKNLGRANVWEMLLANEHTQIDYLRTKIACEGEAL